MAVRRESTVMVPFPPRNPTGKIGIIIVPGEFHVPSHYLALADSLCQHNYEVTICDLPSNGHRGPFPDISQDVRSIKHLIANHIRRDMNVLLVMHSMGGIFGAEACEGNRPTDQRSGIGVIGLVYIAGFVPTINASLMSVSGRHFPWVKLRGEPNTGIFMDFDGDAKKIFFDDCVAELADDAASKLVPFSESACHHKCTYPAWVCIDSNYLICINDKAIVWQSQVRQALQPGLWKRVEWITAGHAPFLSRLLETVNFIRRCAGEEPRAERRL